MDAQRIVVPQAPENVPQSPPGRTVDLKLLGRRDRRQHHDV